MTEISDKYAGQRPRGNVDAVSSNVANEKRAELEEIVQQGIQPNEATETFEDAWSQITSGAENVAATGNEHVQNAILSAAQQAASNVESAFQTKEEKMARAFVDELERRGTPIWDTHYDFDSDAPDLSDAEQQAREVEWLASVDAVATGEVDDDNNPIYRNADGSEFVLS